MTATIVKVFLASPGDLSDERLIVRARADHFNKLWSDEYGIHFRVVGWEELPPVSQRPQRRINRDADDCQIFVGMMGSRWGTDSGQFSSGFEEEFVSANTRRKSTGIPEIALFFRAIDSAMTADPGPQLSRVLQFKNSIIESKEFLFKEFATSADLSDFVDGVFAEFAKTRKEQLAAQSIGIEPKRARTGVDASTTTHDSLDAGTIVAALTAARTHEADGGTDALDLWVSLRLLVYSTSVYAESREHISLGVHEVNLVFRKRNQWNLTQQECLALVDAMLCDANHYSPGWYWLAAGGVDAARDRLWYLSLSGSGARAGAAAILALDNQLPSDTNYIRDAIMDSATAPFICQLLGRIGGAEYLSLLAEAKSNAKLKESSEQPFATAEFAILARSGATISDASIAAYAAKGIDEAVSLLRLKIGFMDDTAIQTLLAGMSVGREREILVRTAFESRRLNPQLAEQLLSDGDPRIRETAVRALIAAGRAFARADLESLFPTPAPGGGGLLSGGLLLSGLLNRVDIALLVKESLRLRSFEELKALVNFFDLDGPAALAVIADLHWTLYEDEIARQLDCDYQILMEEADLRSKEQNGFSILNLWTAKDGSLIEYVRSNFLESALSGVRSHGHRRAAEWATKFSGANYRDTVRAIALQILAQLREPLNYPKLLASFDSLSPESAIMIIPELQNNIAIDTQFVETVSAHPSAEVRDAFSDSLVQVWRDSYLPLLEPLLLSTIDKPRMLAARTLSKALSTEILEALLDKYIELPSYYYDVVTVLDRRIYAVSPFRERLS